MASEHYINTVKSSAFRTITISRKVQQDKIRKLEEELADAKNIDHALMLGQVGMAGSCPHCNNAHFPHCTTTNGE